MAWTRPGEFQHGALKTGAGKDQTGDVGDGSYTVGLAEAQGGGDVGEISDAVLRSQA